MCIRVCLYFYFDLSTIFYVSSFFATFFFCLNIDDNDMFSWLVCPPCQPVWCFRWSLCLFALCRRLSEEASGGHQVRWQRLHQKDERWLWPSTLLFQRITVGSEDLNPLPLTSETLQRTSEGVGIQITKGIQLYVADSSLILILCFRAVGSEWRHSRHQP